MSEELRLGDQDLLVDERARNIYRVNTTATNHLLTLFDYYSISNMDPISRTTINSWATTYYSTDTENSFNSTTISWSQEYENTTDIYSIIEVDDLSKIITKEDVFVKIVDILKKYLDHDFNVLSQIRRSLKCIRKKAEEFFDNCLFVCDSKNNKVIDKTILDFYFTEKDNKKRRHYRFVVNKKRIDVFEM